MWGGTQYVGSFSDSPVCLCFCRFVCRSVITHSGAKKSCTERKVIPVAHVMSALHILILRKQYNCERAITAASRLQAYRHANGLQHLSNVGEGDGAVSLSAGSGDLCILLTVQRSRLGSTSIKQASGVV